MRVVGTVALDPGRVPRATVATLAADVVTAVWSGVRTGARAVVHDVAAMLRACRPTLVAVLTATRPRPRLVAVSFARAASSLASTDATPRRGSSVQGRAAGAPVRRYELALPADPTAPRRARALLQEAAQDWGVPEELYHDAAMVVTELVANAVDHARTASTLTLGLDDEGLSIAVRDGNMGQAPRPRPVNPTAPRGRGLQMVEALTVSWGVTVHSDGKSVWAVLAGA